MEKSVISTGMVPTVEDCIPNLFTCTGQGHETHWVAQAVLVEEPA